ncbi:expressed unknown protein [Seminavis robusta]|uniref:Nucleotidyltransferase n=1 Tax=Seminavis robusta TaxID=568900 RepID=A0A9N8HCL7_9STRA|nr:expressed unknown protein [Seminavis robusta]|eukprot:Sro307_g113310.1 n/a (374) ;mRNA; r:39835-40956
MGGNVFENTRRLTPEAYQSTVDVVAAAVADANTKNLWGKHHALMVSAPPSLADKTSFGDVDILIGLPSALDNDEARSFMAEVARSVFDAVGGLDRTTSKSGKQNHILTKDRFQLDLAFVDEAKFATSVACASHGRFMHLLNMMLTKQALKMTDDGLKVGTGVGGGKNRKKRTNTNDVVLCRDLDQIADFFGFDKAIFDGVTRFSASDIISIIMDCRFFDIRRFHNLDSRQDLLKASPLFVELRDRIVALGGDGPAYQAYCRNISGPRKAGRITAEAFGIDFDELKHNSGEIQAEAIARKRLHGGMFIRLVPEMRHHKQLLPQMPDLLLVRVSQDGNWGSLLVWCDTASVREQMQVVEEILAKAIASNGEPMKE